MGGLKKIFYVFNLRTVVWIEHTIVLNNQQSQVFVLMPTHDRVVFWHGRVQTHWN